MAVKTSKPVMTADDRLKGFVQRIEKLEADKAAVAEGIKQVYGEVKGQGFDTKVLRRTIADRRKKRAEIDAFQAELGLYSDAVADVPTARDAALSDLK